MTRSAEFFPGHTIGDILEKSVNAIGKSGAKVSNPRIINNGIGRGTVRHIFRHRRCAGRGPESNFFNAIFNTKSPARTRYFNAPPATQAKSSIAALAQQITHRTAFKAHVNTIEGNHEIARLLAKTGTIEKCLYMRDIAAKISHHAERMREKSLDVKIGMPPRFRCFARLISRFTTCKTHFVNTVNLFAHFAFCDIFPRLVRRLRKIMVEIAAEVQILFCGISDHIAGFIYIVGQGFFTQNVSASGESLHRRFIVPTAILISPGRDIDNIQILVLQHIFETIISFNTVSFRSPIRGLFDNIAHRNEICKVVFCMTTRMPVANTTHTNNANFKCHKTIS